jgi:hypothetical protein
MRTHSECNAPIFSCWLLHFIDLEPVVVIEPRPVSHAAVLGRYLDAVAAEPLDRYGWNRTWLAIPINDRALSDGRGGEVLCDSKSGIRAPRFAS